MRILVMLQKEELVCDCEGSAAKMQSSPSGGISVVNNDGPVDQLARPHATSLHGSHSLDLFKPTEV